MLSCPSAQSSALMDYILGVEIVLLLEAVRLVHYKVQ